MTDLAPGPLSSWTWLTSWRFDAVGVVLSVLLLVPYVWLLVAAWRRGVQWPWWRIASYVVLGVGTLLYVTCGVVGVYRQTFLWMFAAQVAIIGTVTPMGLAVGDPLRLLAAATGSTDTVLHRVVRSRIVRLLIFPAVSSVLDIGGILAVFFTGYGQRAIESELVGTLLILQLLIVGLIFVLPTLAEDLLPGWATPAVRTFLAFFDGIADAVPGILVMVANTTLFPHFPGFSAAADPLRSGLSHYMDQKYAGGALLAVAEGIGVPMLAAVFVEWLHSDAAEARATDAELDRAEAARTPAATTAPEGCHADQPETVADQPWWLTDPRLADRYGKRDD
ncbi:cytochrome c oxidase assembly protein [Flexivirga caeni]|uniref:Cytochrome c oxidase assembly protein n=1 Tax=Flexivirga caeni TaxID=2294115 RepID=A0A3M9M861_9MICO|nr:cytochrome c oxidase assembly protein [Flexivirga caeni]RNI21387.1 cytochrome c oxidase assembly protein [Flexivirga caeni]